MNTINGQLEYLDCDRSELLKKLYDENMEQNNPLIPIDMDQATSKQKDEMKVSKYDSISTLGKLFTGARKERRLKAKQLKKQLKKS